MSGHKRTTVALSQADFRRLQEAEARLRSVEQDYQAVKSRARSIHSQELSASFRQLEERQQRFQQALAGVDQDLSELESHTSQALLDHFGQLQDQVAQLSGQVTEDTSALVAASSERLEQGLEQLSLQHQQQLERLQRSLRSLHRSARGREALAGQALLSAQALLEALHAAYSLPPEARLLVQDLDQAQANFEQGFLEAALAGAQRCQSHLSELRLRLEQQLARRSALLLSLRSQAGELYERGRLSRSLPALGLDGQPLDFAIDLPFWSDGAFQAWSARCRELLRQLERPVDELDLPALEAMQASLPALEQELSDLIYQARLNVIASQVRFNVAACIVQALQEQGFELSQAAYDASDQRLAYQACLRAFDGSEVVVHVSPVAGEAALTDIDLLSHDAALRSEHELRQRAHELARSLQAFGLQVGQLSLPAPALSVRQPAASYSARQPAPAEIQPEPLSSTPYAYPERPSERRPAPARLRRTP